MKKTLAELFLSTVLVCAISEAEPVAWNAVSSYDVGINKLQAFCVNSNSDWLNITGYVVVDIAVEGNVASLKDPGFYLPADSPGKWIPSQEGDVVSAATMRDQPSYFYGDNPEHYEAIVETDASYFFRFELENPADEAWHYERLEINGRKNCPYYKYFYGWVEYSVDSSGSLTILNSAIGLNGQSMTVGLIPEPSAMALLVLGLAPLMLRRRPARHFPAA